MAQTHTTLLGKLMRLVVEGGSRNLTFEGLQRRMQEDGRTIEAGFAVAPDTPANRRQAIT